MDPLGSVDRLRVRSSSISDGVADALNQIEGIV
jgi:hypothetical protein